MAKGVFDKAYMESKGAIVNERICEVTCLTNEATWVNPRKTAMFNLVAPRYKGEITSDEYEVQVTVPQNFRFTGRVPYDMTIVSDQAFVKIVAESFDSALFKVRDFFGIENV